MRAFRPTASVIGALMVAEQPGRIGHDRSCAVRGIAADAAHAAFKDIAHVTKGLRTPFIAMLPMQGGRHVNDLRQLRDACRHAVRHDMALRVLVVAHLDRKSTRLNSSHSQISYAVFCLKKKKNNIIYDT